MFEDYTTTQLVELRWRCADMLGETEDIEKRADTLLLLEHVEEELAMRGARLAAA
jgi:hypothetical protein